MTIRCTNSQARSRPRKQNVKCLDLTPFLLRRDKSDLFLSDTDEFFEGIAMALSRFGCRSERVAPVHELFAHISEMRAFHRALSEAGKLSEVWELGQEHFARGIAWPAV